MNLRLIATLTTLLGIIGCSEKSVDGSLGSSNPGGGNSIVASVSTGASVTSNRAVFLDANGDVNQFFAPVINTSSETLVSSAETLIAAHAVDSTHFVQVFHDSNTSATTGVLCASASGISCNAPFSIGTEPPKGAIVNGNTLLVLYQDSANSQLGTAVACDASSGTCGTPVVFDSSGVHQDYQVATNMTAGGAFVVTFMDANNSDEIMVVAMSVSGTTITVGTPVDVGSTAAGEFNYAVEKLDANAFVLTYLDSTNSDVPTVVSGSISGTTITLGTPTASAGSPAWLQASFRIVPLDATGFIVEYTNTNAGIAVVGQVSGTNVSLGSEILHYRGAVKLDSTHVIFAASGFGSVCTIAGTGISCPSVGRDTYAVIPDHGNQASVVLLSSTRFLLGEAVNSQDPNMAVVSECFIAGSTITCSNAISVVGSTLGSLKMLLAQGSGAVAIRSGVPGYPSNYATSVSPSAATSSSFSQGAGLLGIATSAGASGGSVAVSVGGAVAGFSGLSAGSFYYANGDGSVTAFNTGIQLGIAISSTQILMNGESPFWPIVPVLFP